MRNSLLCLPVSNSPFVSLEPSSQKSVYVLGKGDWYPSYPWSRLKVVWKCLISQINFYIVGLLIKTMQYVSPHSYQEWNYSSVKGNTAKCFMCLCIICKHWNNGVLNYGIILINILLPFFLCWSTFVLLFTRLKLHWSPELELAGFKWLLSYGYRKSSWSRLSCVCCLSPRLLSEHIHFSFVQILSKTRFSH